MGHPDAQFNLGTMYTKGLGVPQDYNSGILEYVKAARQGHAPAQFNLGAMFQKGQEKSGDVFRAGICLGFVRRPGTTRAEMGVRRTCVVRAGSQAKSS